jgi:hypothetical protein
VSDILVLLAIVAVPAMLALGPLAVLTLGIAAVSDLDGTGLVRGAGSPRPMPQPAPGSTSSEVPADGSPAIGPASRMSSVTPSA